MENILEKYRTYIVSFLILVIVIGLFLIYKNPLLSRFNLKGDEGMNRGQNKKEIVVDIAGAVKKPGVYSFKEGARVRDGLNKAEGLSSKADLDIIARQINQARFLEDEEKIFLPFKQTQKTVKSGQGETHASGKNESMKASEKLSGKSTAGARSSSSVGPIVNINKASKAELETLPGIGSVYGGRIVEYRNTNGGFSSVNELEEISGIGPKTLEKLKPLVEL